MEIIGESAHRMLAYVEAVRRQGHALTAEEFKAYASGWDQKVTSTGDYASVVANFNRVAAMALGTGRREVEPMLDYLARVRWITNYGGKVDITSLGKAVLREANTPLPDSEVGSTLEVIIDPKDPFAYAQLMSKIAGFEDCLVVDPYLELEQLQTLGTFQSVTRILTSNKDSRRKTPVFAMVLEAFPHLSVRMAEQKLLHDRIVMPSDGSALMLGSSLASITRRFGVATPLEATSSRLIRKHYDEIWAGAKAIDPAPSEPAVLTTAATVDEGTGS